MDASLAQVNHGKWQVAPPEPQQAGCSEHQVTRVEDARKALEEVGSQARELVLLDGISSGMTGAACQRATRRAAEAALAVLETADEHFTSVIGR